MCPWGTANSDLLRGLWLAGLCGTVGVKRWLKLNKTKHPWGTAKSDFLKGLWLAGLCGTVGSGR